MELLNLFYFWGSDCLFIFFYFTAGTNISFVCFSSHLQLNYLLQFVSRYSNAAYFISFCSSIIFGVITTLREALLENL